MCALHMNTLLNKCWKSVFSSETFSNEAQYIMRIRFDQNACPDFYFIRKSNPFFFRQVVSALLSSKNIENFLLKRNWTENKKRSKQTRTIHPSHPPNQFQCIILLFVWIIIFFFVIHSCSFAFYSVWLGFFFCWAGFSFIVCILTIFQFNIRPSMFMFYWGIREISLLSFFFIKVF